MASIERRQFVRSGLGAAFAGSSLIRAAGTPPPNILWITAEDMGPQLGCYGYSAVTTPNLDRLASQGVLFTRAFTAAPVCSASRSGFNTGMYQTSIGAHHHRSHRKDGYTLPDGVRLITDHMRERGYFTANVGEMMPNVRGSGKTDFNFTAVNPYDGTHWRQRRSGQPFFAHINFQATHKGPAFVEARKQPRLIDPASVKLPPYYPDDPVVRDEFANYLDAVNLLDNKVGAVLRALDRDGLGESTLVFFFGDHGRCLLRGKQWLYDAGIHIPMMVRWPGYLEPGAVREDPVSAIDMTATCLWAGGAGIPPKMQGRPLFGEEARPRDAIFAARDRCDMTVDRIRCVRDRRYKFIRNFMPERPYTQHNAYIEKQYPTLGVLKKYHAEGKLDPVQSLFMQPRKPTIEFYDTESDPHEVHNLASAPEHRARVAQFGRMLDRWIEETGDMGAIPETKESAEL